MFYVLLAASLLGAAGIQYAINGFSALACLWQFPLLTAGMMVGLVLLFLLVLFVSTLFVDPKKMLEKPSAYFRFMLNQFCRLALFLGGLPAVIEEYSGSLPGVESGATDEGFISVFTLNQAIFGLLIVLFLVFEPRGLAAMWLRLKAYFRAWPFSY